MTGIAGCCARAASGHAAATPPRSVMNSRRLIDHLVGGGEQRGRHGEAEHPGGLGVDDQLEFCRLRDRWVRSPPVRVLPKGWSGDLANRDVLAFDVAL